MRQGKAADDFPKGNTKTVYVKARGFSMVFPVDFQMNWLARPSEVHVDFNREELFFKSDDKEIFEGIIKDFKEAHVWMIGQYRTNFMVGVIDTSIF